MPTTTSNAAPSGTSALLSLTAEPMIQARNLSLTLSSQAGAVPILHQVSLTLAAGERAAIVGPSGSGKTSLLMLLAGLESATSGQLTVAGQNLIGRSEDALARFRRDSIGVVFQSFHLVPTMTALENVCLPLELAGRGDAAPAARAALAAVGLGHRLDHFPGQLSGGEQQRVGLARAFVAGPKVLLADEPTGNLDGETAERVIEVLFDLAAQQGVTLLLVTHDPRLAARCDRQFRMADGRLTEIALPTAHVSGVQAA